MIEVGDTFGAWEVVEEITANKYRCICTVCRDTVSSIRSYDLEGGKTRMCVNCSQTKDEEVGRPPEYHSWMAMMQRCYNPNSKDYPNYGGRGISVYPLWKESFDSFYIMMGPRPEPGLTLDRIDSNGNYEPGNVRWATRDAQTKNQRSNINITIGDETKTVAEWGDDPAYPVNKFTIYKRIKRGWDPVRAVKEPSNT